MLISVAFVFVLSAWLGLENAVETRVGLWKELVQCFYWNRCRVSSAARNFDKMAQTTSYNFLLRTKKSAPLFPLLLLILTAGKTDLLLRKLYRGKLFLKTFFTDFINGQKEI